jgi:hypothetical protein
MQVAGSSKCLGSLQGHQTFLVVGFFDLLCASSSRPMPEQRAGPPPTSQHLEQFFDVLLRILPALNALPPPSWLPPFTSTSIAPFAIATTNICRCSGTTRIAVASANRHGLAKQPDGHCQQEDAAAASK